jgi:HK97 family phage major capsid protein
MTAQELREKINKLATDMKAIYQKAADEKRDMTAEENEKFDQMDSERETLAAQERRELRMQSLEDGSGRQSEPRQPAEYRRDGSEQRGKVTNTDRLNTLRGWMLPPDERTDEMRASAKRTGVNLDSKRFTVRLAQHPLTSLRPEEVRAWEERIVAGVVSPDGGGHFTIPDEGMRSLEQALLAFGGIRQVATVIRTNSGAELPIPTVDDTGNTGALLAEISEHTELDVTFEQLTLGAYKYTSRLVKVSVEYLQDNAIGAAETIGRLLGERIGRITSAHFTTGTGSSQPNGVVTAATSSAITTAGASTITYDNVIDLKHSVDPAYRTGARFMFNDTTLKILKKLKVAQFSGDTGGQPLWRAGFATGEPDTIDGDPYTINQQVASGTGTKALLYGLMSKYIIRDVRDITLVRLDERYAEFGQVGFFAFSRHDGDLLDAGTNPVKYLTMG